MGNELPFGGVAVILIGDPGQLPAVVGNVLWYPHPSNEADKAGLNIYLQSTKNAMELEEVHRIIGDPDAALYLEIMKLTRCGTASKEEWATVVKNCTREAIGEHL